MFIGFHGNKSASEFRPNIMIDSSKYLLSSDKLLHVVSRGLYIESLEQIDKWTNNIYIYVSTITDFSENVLQFDGDDISNGYRSLLDFWQFLGWS